MTKATRGKESLQAVLREAAKALEGVGISDALFEARALMEAVVGLTQGAQIQRALLPLSSRQLALFDAGLKRRLKREPLSRIAGFQEFYGLRFSLNHACLAPRADSEIMIDWALETKPKARRVLDLCCGSGALGLAVIKHLPKAQLLGTDLSTAALQMAKKNAKDLGLKERSEFLACDLLPEEGFDEGFDLVLCNPPYIPSAELAGLMPEVRDFDAPLCLDGGPDGLTFYRRLLPQIPTLIAAGAALFFEHGASQQEALWALVEKGLQGVMIEARKDYGQRDRVLRILWPEKEDGHANEPRTNATL